MSTKSPDRPKTRRRTPVVQLTLPRELLDAVDRWAAAESARRFGARVTRSQAVRELCTAALGGAAPARTSPGARPIRAFRLGEEPEGVSEPLTPAERIEMIGELTLTAYQMRGQRVVPGIRRDVVRVVRRGR